MSYKRPHDVSRVPAQQSGLESSHRKAWCGESRPPGLGGGKGCKALPILRQARRHRYRCRIWHVWAGNGPALADHQQSHREVRPAQAGDAFPTHVQSPRSQA
jgi:hypothetical protein